MSIRKPFLQKLFFNLLVLAIVLTSFRASTAWPKSSLQPSAPVPVTAINAANNPLYLPAVMNASGQSSKLKVNVPYFPGSVALNQMAIFWFGKVTPDETYVDVRMGYTGAALHIHIAVIDRRLWCSKSTSSGNLSAWDAAELYLDTGNGASAHLSSLSHRFAGQLSSYDCPANTSAYQGSGTGWQIVSLPFTAKTGWRGNAPNDNSDDRGWTMDEQIPFSSLGFPAAPAPGTVWKLALQVHDRNDSAGTVVSQKQWPDSMKNDQPATWADMVFGLPAYVPPTAVQDGVVTVRNKLNGVSVLDGQVGGSTVCGDGLDFWTQWGETSYPGNENNDKVNIQNQGDIADWPCFSKFYVTFPLNSIPAGQVILSAQLRLHQFGNSGSPADTPPRSLIQVFTVGQDWTKAKLTWNNAPQMTENVSQAWVDPLSSFPGWPGILRTWDVSRAVAEAYGNGAPLRLALYSSDEGYHSGKYFVSSDTGDWNAAARPELQIVIGRP